MSYRHFSNVKGCRPLSAMTVLIVIAIVSCPVRDAFAVKPSPIRNRMVGFRAGIWAGGTATAEARKGDLRFDLNTDADFTLGVFSDKRLSRLTSISFSADAYKISIPFDDQLFFDLGVSLKGKIPARKHSVVIRPGAGLGLGLLNELTFQSGGQALS